MACCGQKTTHQPTSAVGTVQTTGTVQNRRTRKWISIYQSLVDAVPDGGWIFKTSLKGMPVIINGTSPVDAMAKTRDAFSKNSVPFDEFNFWLEANIQWTERTDIKHHLSSVADLMAIKAGRGGQPVVHPVANHPPGEWGSVAWRFLGLVLAKSTYDHTEFISVFRMITDMLNPVTNPRIGCAECHIEASGMLNDLVHNTIPNLASARIWLVNKHNLVNERLGKPQLQMSEAASANFWD